MEITLKDGKTYITSYIKFEGFMLIFIPQNSGTTKEEKVYVREIQNIISHEKVN